MVLINISRRHAVIADRLITYKGFRAFLGLMGVAKFPKGNALYLEGTKSIHTWFMRISIDLIFVDADLSVLQTFEFVSPWSVRMCKQQVYGVLELPAGTLHEREVQKGDRLCIQ